MYKRSIAICILALLTIGCADLKEMTRLKQFEDIALGYQHAMRWSDFDYVVQFVDPSTIEANPPDPQILKLVKVTDYKVRKTAASEDENQVYQYVEISYYRTDKMIVNTITERETWEWDKEGSQWRLKSGFPDFK
jgi:hypothetical protein